MGRRVSDLNSFHTLDRAYEFPTKHYPQTVFRAQESLAIGEIYRTDLNDSPQAKKTFRKYLDVYPKSEKAADARDALNDIQLSSASHATTRNAAASGPVPAIGPPSAIQQIQQESSRAGHTLEVTSVRRWVGPNYTRIVIGVDGEVGFDAIRLGSPDRLVFDLTNARPSPELMGKTFPVEDGFLHQIRVALLQAHGHPRRSGRGTNRRLFRLPSSQSVSSGYRYSRHAQGINGQESAIEAAAGRQCPGC